LLSVGNSVRNSFCWLLLTSRWCCGSYILKIFCFLSVCVCGVSVCRICIDCDFERWPSSRSYEATVYRYSE
jgi:hypothetical protein